jgi:hypothetical protein
MRTLCRSLARSFAPGLSVESPEKRERRSSDAPRIKIKGVEV